MSRSLRACSYMWSEPINISLTIYICVALHIDGEFTRENSETRYQLDHFTHTYSLYTIYIQIRLYERSAEISWNLESVYIHMRVYPVWVWVWVWATKPSTCSVTRAARAHCLKLKTICTTAASWTKRVSVVWHYTSDVQQSKRVTLYIVCIYRHFMYIVHIAQITCRGMKV